MVAIVTKYIGPTDYRGSRIKATAGNGQTITIGYDHELSIEKAHRKAAQALCDKMKWTGKLMKKTEVYNKFVFASKRQIMHVNGLTYDFLYGMAKELEDSQSLMLLGAGPKGNQPLVLTRGGQQYRGFLEGRTDGDKYCLILHLSNMELKAAAAPSEEPPQ